MFGRLKLKFVAPIGLCTANFAGRSCPMPYGVYHGPIFDFDPAMDFSSDRIFSPVRRTPAKAGEIDIADRDDIRLKQLAAGFKTMLVSQFMIPIAIYIHDGAFERRENLEAIGGAGVFDIAANDDRIECIFLQRPQFSDSHQIVVDVRKCEQPHLASRGYDTRLRRYNPQHPSPSRPPAARAQ